MRVAFLVNSRNCHVEHPGQRKTQRRPWSSRRSRYSPGRMPVRELWPISLWFRGVAVGERCTPRSLAVAMNLKSSTFTVLVHSNGGAKRPYQAGPLRCGGFATQALLGKTAGAPPGGTLGLTECLALQCKGGQQFPKQRMQYLSQNGYLLACSTSLFRSFFRQGYGRGSRSLALYLFFARA